MSEVQNILQMALNEIGQMRGRWSGFFHGLSAAYAAAYQSQEYILETVKATIEARKKQREAEISFILSLVTVGLGGPAASKFATEVDEIVKTLLEGQKVLSKAWENRERIGSVLKSIEQLDPILSDWAGRSVGLGGVSSVGAFKPVSVTPAEYGDTMHQGLEERTNVMVKTVMEKMKDASTSKQQALQLLNGQRTSKFFTEAPDETMSHSTRRNLRLQARIALWAGWGRNRDKDYWSREQFKLLDPGRAFVEGTEFWDWEALANELVQLGLGRFVISQVVPNSNSIRPDFRVRRGILFPHFIQWSFSLEAFDTIFRMVQTDAEGIIVARNEWVRHLAMLQ